MRDSSPSSSANTLVLALCLLVGAVWLVKSSLEPAPPAAPAPTAEETSTTQSRAIDYSQANTQALNNSMSDQLKSVQSMVGGSYDGQTYVPPRAR